MQHTRVKICGITNTADALAACAAGADALGFVFYPGSPRYVAAETVQQIARQLPPFVTKVGLFVDAEQTQVEKIVQTAGLDALQFHGDESPAYCKGFASPWYKAVRMRKEVDLCQVCTDYGESTAILLDSYVPGRYGGTGVSFAWERIPADLSKPLILAGGLEPDNVSTAIQKVQPYAVDVSGGVEKTTGRKDPDKMRLFIHEVIHA